MPYGGTTPEEDKLIERCVADIKGINKRTNKPYTESEKIAICKAGVLKKRNMSVDDIWLAYITNIK